MAKKKKANPKKKVIPKPKKKVCPHCNKPITQEQIQNHMIRMIPTGKVCKGPIKVAMHILCAEEAKVDFRIKPKKKPDPKPAPKRTPVEDKKKRIEDW